MDVAPIQTKTNKKGKIYGIAYGRKMRAFANKWAKTKLLTDGFIGAKYKGFASASDAWKFVLNENKSIQAPKCFNEVNYLSDNEIKFDATTNALVIVLQSYPRWHLYFPRVRQGFMCGV